MRRLHLERAIVRPEINRVGYACAAPFVNLDVAVSHLS